MATKKTKQKEPAPEVLELGYQLAELPSSQHRAGLAGLVLMVDWLKQQPNLKGICEIDRTAHSATLRTNQQGLEELFNEIYAASREEQERAQLMKNSRTKEVIPPVREEVRQTLDPKTGKTKERTVYYYGATIPKGGFLLKNDPTGDGLKGDWIKLWRDVIWNIFRGVPATRAPFDARANQEETTDAADAWQELVQPSEYTVQLPSTYFIGAQANNAENVPFKDRARFQFLLHFWPYAAQIYVPAVVNNKNEVDFLGYALAIPDVADLELFCEELPEALRDRGTQPFRPRPFRPRDCVVDLAVEGALDTFRRLRERLRRQAGSPRINDLILGIDVVHVNKEGNNIRLLGTTRLEPEDGMIDEYARFRDSLWSPIFRQQRLLNLVNPNRNWFLGFDNLMSKLPYEQTIGNSYFRRDARESFKNEVKTMNKSTDSYDDANDDDLEVTETSGDETLVFRVVKNYLNRKLKAKYQLEFKPVWKGIRDNKPNELKKYEEMKAKLAREAFLAIRSRTDQDFVEYFASTLCSVPQRMSEERFVALTKALVERRDEIRTLTMLALAAQTPNPQASSTQPASGQSASSS